MRLTTNSSFYSLLLGLITVSGWSPFALSDQNETLDDLFSEELPVVLSATRLKQPRSESPASVTVIERETLKELGVRTLAEALRMVPGMYVGYERGHSPEVGYHTLAAENSRHLQVLVDGRSIYQPALARILWNDLPLAIDKVSRIEVIRGPNTAMYGANSYLAVINIITLHPEDLEGGKLQAITGNHGISDGQVRYAQQIGDVAYEVTIAKHSDDGFEVNDDGSPRFDAHDTIFLSSDLIWHQNTTDFIRLQFGISDSDKQIDDIDASEMTPYHMVDTDNQFLQFNWQQSLSSNTDIKLQAFSTDTRINEVWRACLPALLLSEELYDLFALDPLFTEQLLAFFVGGGPLPSTNDPQVLAQALLVQQRLMNNGAVTTCGDANQNLTEHRNDIEFQLTSQLNERTRLVSGISYREDSVSSESYFNGNASKSIWRLFGNAEYSLEDWRFNLGLMHERDSIIGNETTPRLAVNWLSSSNQSIRLIYSRANRSPDLFEEKATRSYTLRNLDQPVNGTDSFATYYQHTSSSGGLDYEQIKSYELGWYYRSDDQALEFDIKLFHDQLTNLLEGRTSISSFDITNKGNAELTGVEAQVHWLASSKIKLWSTASHIDFSDDSDSFYVKTGAQNTFTLNGFFAFDNGIKLSSSYYYYHDWYSVDFKRLDASIGYNVQLGEQTLDTRLTYQHRFDENFLLDVRNNYRNPDKIYLSVALRW